MDFYFLQSVQVNFTIGDLLIIICNTNKPMSTCSFFIGCYTEVDHLISTKVFGYVWLRCNHIIDHV